MDSPYLDFINNEKDLSRVKIDFIKKKTNISASNRRILDIENSFINFDFNSVGIDTLDDARSAVSLYRSSRALFCIKYGLEYEDIISNYKCGSLFSSVRSRVMVVARKFEYLRNSALIMVDIKPQQINAVQDSKYFEEYCKSFSLKNNCSVEDARSTLGVMNVEDLARGEPATLARQRAREQSIVCAAGIFIKRSVDIFGDFLIKKLMDYGKDYYNEAYILKDLSLDKYSESEIYNLCDSSEIIMDKIMHNFIDNLYMGYNDAISYLKNMDGTMGFNPYIQKSNRIVNLFGDNCFLKGQDHNNIKYKIIGIGHKEKAKVHKRFGIPLCVPRKGNEKMDLLYKKIYVSNIDITEYFNNSLSNIVMDDNNGGRSYYKALCIKKEFQNNFFNYFGDKEMYIDLETSSCLVPKTRADNYFLKDCFNGLLNYFNLIKNDYFSIEKHTINERIDRINNRKNFIYKISGR